MSSRGSWHGGWSGGWSGSGGGWHGLVVGWHGWVDWDQRGEDDAATAWTLQWHGDQRGGDNTAADSTAAAWAPLYEARPRSLDRAIFRFCETSMHLQHVHKSTISGGTRERGGI